ncbi:M55 family metallopeptidase [Mycoplana dimorpha]|uniref:M55 family metallopeptidase n=1 Tax=Mycoplana dimorpha TaxID=28320 RepID=UPI0024781928|nr:M55 family metallopeptidase [Mycoplana dimorpha]
MPRQARSQSARPHFQSAHLAAAAGYGVPSVFLAGDEGICAEARAMAGGLATVETLDGKGLASTSISPA